MHATARPVARTEHVDLQFHRWLEPHVFEMRRRAVLRLTNPMPNNGTKLRTMDAAEVSITVDAPVAAVYKRWLAFEDYPKFITAIKRTRKLDANHFVASLGFNGKAYETTLEMMLRVPERRLAWRTLANYRAPDHFAAGVVSFAPLSDQSTCVTLKLTSSFGGAVSRRVGIYLQNFKKLIENEAAKEDWR